MRSSPERLNRLDHFLAVSVRFPFGPGLRNFSVLVDDVSNPRYAPILLSIHALLLPRAVFLGRRMVNIGKEREVQVVFGCELLMQLFIVGRNSQPNRSEF